MTNGKEKLADALYQAVKGFVTREFDRMFQKAIAPLQKMIEEIPSGKDGAKGEDGKPGADGKSVEIESVRELVIEEVKKIPVPENGKDADPEFIKAEVAKAVARIEKPADGQDGRDGRDGAKGEPGKDAFQIDPQSMIDEAKSYPRGTWATHKRGLWRATKTTNGMDGWECMVDGVAGVAAVQDPEDPRRIMLGIKMASGQIVEEVLHIPFVIDKGVFKEDQPGGYKAGDGVTWARHYWIATKDTDEKPDFGSSWRLAVKGGRDGSNGRDGIDKTLPVKLS